MGWNQDDGEVLARGPDRPPLWKRVPSRWRAWLTGALVFCLGLLLGGGGVHTWDNQQREQRPRVQAGVSLEGQSARRVGVGLRLVNGGRHPVTVQKARLRVQGFRVVSGGLDEANRIGRRGSIDVSYKLAVVCGTTPHRATARLRVRRPDGDRQWLNVPLVLAPGYAASSLTSAHFSQCTGNHAEALLRFRTKRVNHPRGGGLDLRVRVSAVAGGDFGHAGQPKSRRLRLRGVDSSAGFRASFAPKAKGHDSSAGALPQVGTVHVEVTRCSSLRGPSSEPFLTAEVATGPKSSGATTTAVVIGDLRYRAATSAYFADRCS